MRAISVGFLLLMGCASFCVASDASRSIELVFIETVNGEANKVTTIPETRLSHSEQMSLPDMPFQITPLAYYPNAALEKRPEGDDSEPLATAGIGDAFKVKALPPAADKKDQPAVYVELSIPHKLSLVWLAALEFPEPQDVNYDGRRWKILLRSSLDRRPISQFSSPAAAASVVASPELAWTAPQSWSVKPASAMRKGSYAITDADGGAADLSITAFPGEVGGELANVNRWRGQMGLPPITEIDLPAFASHLTSNGLSFLVVDFASVETPQRILAAQVHNADETWFFKLYGPATLVEQQKSAFLAFLRTVKSAANSQ